MAKIVPDWLYVLQRPTESGVTMQPFEEQVEGRSPRLLPPIAETVAFKSPAALAYLRLPRYRYYREHVRLTSLEKCSFEAHRRRRAIQG